MGPKERKRVTRMVLYNENAVWRGGMFEREALAPQQLHEGRQKTIAYQILKAHNVGGEGQMRLRFDSLISHDITYVGIIQTAVASGMRSFPVPYVLTNCHNSLCAVGGTINEDDHIFGLSAAQKFGGVYVPANQAVIHQYAREMMAGCGKMILGSDSHTRYGALGTMGVGEGGPELVKQLLRHTYDIAEPEVVLVYLKGAPRRGVGPHDVAIALCGEVYKNGFVKNRILEFAGPGVADLPMDYRIGIDVMTTETACLSSIWQTDEKVRDYLALHGRKDDYRALSPEDGACYDRVIEIDLSKIEPMIALPFHPSEAYPIRVFRENAADLLRETEKRAEAQLGGKVSLRLTDKLEDGKLRVDQGIIAGCAGGMYDNIAEAAAILEGGSVGSGYFSLSVYPPSMPVQMELLQNGVQQKLMTAGAVFKPCFCGPCFGAGDVPGNSAFSIRHTTRNFPNREGSRPADGQLSAVALMDARSIAATAKNGGILTAATEMEYEVPTVERTFDDSAYRARVYFGFGDPKPDTALRYGPNITPWPEIAPLGENLLVELAAVIDDPVTTTDELIPSGETSSYRSNPRKLSEFALSRRVPDYVPRAKQIADREQRRQDGDKELAAVLDLVGDGEALVKTTQFGSAIFARKPGDGSAREQAASCQRVLGGCANFCYEFATKRYRSNCINWGILPFTIDSGVPFDYAEGDYIYLPNIRAALKEGKTSLVAKVISGGRVSDLTVHLDGLTDADRQILLDGCLMNYYASREG